MWFHETMGGLENHGWKMYLCQLLQKPKIRCVLLQFLLNNKGKRTIITWPNELNNCLRSFFVAWKATFLTINFVVLLSFPTFSSAFPSLEWQSCKIRAWPSKTDPCKKKIKNSLVIWLYCRKFDAWYWLVFCISVPIVLNLPENPCIHSLLSP